MNETKNPSETAHPFFDNISTMLPAVKAVGEFMAASGMFGCSRTEQGEVLAMEMFVRRIGPFQMRREYYLIGGKPMDRADSIAAKYRTRGGRIQIIERSPTRAAAKLTSDGNTVEFSLKWEEIQNETWVKNKEGGLKDNYATPRGRQKMLWWRLLADAVLTMMPEVIAGTLPEEELTPEAEQPALALEKAPAPVMTISNPAPAPPTPTPTPTPKPAAEPTQAPPATSPPANRPPVTAEKNPATGQLSAESIGALIKVIGGNAEPACAFFVRHGWLTSDQAASPDWLAFLPVEKANQVLRKPEGFQKAILKPEPAA